MVILGTIISFLAFILGFYVTWKVFHLFISMDQAFELSTFSYYVKKIGACLVVGFISFAVMINILPVSMGGVDTTKNTPTTTPTTTPKPLN